MPIHLEVPGCHHPHSPADLQEISVIAVFHANVRNPMMRERLRTRTVATLEDLWTMADHCARVEEAASFPPRGVR